MSVEDWVVSPEAAKEASKKSGSSAPAFYDLKNKGDSSEVTFLDPDPSEEFTTPPCLRYHKVFQFEEGQKYPVNVLCPVAKGHECPICKHAESLEDERESANLAAKTEFAYTVINVQKDYKPAKQLRMTSDKQKDVLHAKIESLKSIEKGPMKEINGVHGHTFVVSRPDEDFIPRIGVVGDYLDTPDLSELHSEPVPFTIEEMVSKFESDEEKMQAYVDRVSQESGGFKKPKHNK